jgi:hypothetical protein
VSDTAIDVLGSGSFIALVTAITVTTGRCGCAGRIISYSPVVCVIVVVTCGACRFDDLITSRSGL